MRPNQNKTPEDITNFRESLNDWVQEASIGEKRLDAANKITQAFETGDALLSLNYLGLTSLPAEISQLTQLISLYLSKNNFTSIPEPVLELTQLQQLNINENNITSLPATIPQLTQLKHLDLSQNKLTSIRPEIRQLTQLDNLDFSSNQLRVIPPEIRELTQLMTLDFNKNEIIQIPKEIGKLTQLQFLDFSNNHINEIPTEITDLTQLKYLFLHHNHLTSTIEEIANLTQLTDLDLSANQLTSISEEILTAQYQNNIEIQLEDNLITAEENNRFNEIITNRSDARVTLNSSIYQEPTITAQNIDVLAEILKKSKSKAEKDDMRDFFTSTSAAFQTFISQCNRTKGWENKADDMAISLFEIIKKMKESHEKGTMLKILCENAVSFANTSCEDRVALDFALMQIKMLFPDKKIEQLTFSELFEASKPQAICAALLKAAEEKIKCLTTQGGVIDEIEVYLAYLENVNRDFQIDLGPIYGQYTGGQHSSLNCARVSENDIQTINNKIEEIGIDRLTTDYIDTDSELHKHPEMKEIIDEIGNRKEFDTQKLQNEVEQDYLDRLEQISTKRPQALHQAILIKLHSIILENDNETTKQTTQESTREPSLSERPRTTLYSRFISIFPNQPSIEAEEIPSPIVPAKPSLLRRLMSHTLFQK